jgi:hypothetical protein
MRARRALLAALLAVVVAGAAPSGGGSDAEALRSYLTSEAYKVLLNRALAALPAAVFRHCPKLVMQPWRLVVLQPVIFGSDGRPVGGAWRHSFPVSGCGNDTTLNLFFVAMADGRVTTIFGLPGTTHADLRLQNEALAQVTAAAELAGACDGYLVVDTRFGGYGAAPPAIADPGPEMGAKRPWWETWTLAGCGRVVELAIDFVPEAEGTHIMVPGGGAVRPAPSAP